VTAIRKSGGGNVALTGLKRRSGGGEVNIQNGYRRSGGTWVKVYSAYTPMTVTVADIYATVPATTPNYTTAAATPSVTGGNPSKTYSWTRISGDSFTINSPSGSSTTFTQAGTPLAKIYTGTYRLTVNDGTASVSDDFTVTIERTSGA
jgi:hypothetical protein